MMAVEKVEYNKNRLKKLFLIFIVTAGCLIVGYFALSQLYKLPYFKSIFGIDLTQPQNNPILQYVKYISESAEINDAKQNISIIEIKPAKAITVKPILAQNSIFGFETTSSMIERSGGVGGINAGFTHIYGEPSGLVVVDRRILHSGLGNYPSLICMRDGRILLEQINARIKIFIGDALIETDGVNREPNGNESILFTCEYGSDNRYNKTAANIYIKDGVVKDVIRSNNACRISDDELVLTLTGNNSYIADTITKGLKVRQEVQYFPSAGEIRNAYECGSWIVKHGKVVVKQKDDWVGLTTNREPRTAVGIKQDGTLLMIVVDGRQPGYSEGMTGNELGNFMIGKGVVNGAMLDGGASSTMIFDGKVVNKPSFMERERIIGAALSVMPQT